MAEEAAASETFKAQCREEVMTAEKRAETHATNLKHAFQRTLEKTETDARQTAENIQSMSKDDYEKVRKDAKEEIQQMQARLEEEQRTNDALRASSQSTQASDQTPALKVEVEVLKRNCFKLEANVNEKIVKISDLEEENKRLRKEMMDNPAGIPRDVHAKMLADVGMKNQEVIDKCQKSAEARFCSA